MSIEQPTRIAVVGTGTVGASWAAYFLAHGFDVAATDPGGNAEEALHQIVDAAWPSLERLGLSPGASRERLQFTSHIDEAIEGADFVQESAPEREELKVELFEALDRKLPPEVLIASSSSGLLMTNVQRGCAHPERCVTGHPFNPPHLMPLVEVVGGEQTSPETIESAMEFYRSIGKMPIHIRKEIVGHIANRLQAAIFREAAHLVYSGVASAADVDAAIAYGPGMRWALMGPILTFHLAGGEGGMAHFIDHLGDALNSWIADLGDETIDQAVAEALVSGAEQESAGRSIADLVANRDRFLVELLALPR